MNVAHMVLVVTFASQPAAQQPTAQKELPTEISERNGGHTPARKAALAAVRRVARKAALAAVRQVARKAALAAVRLSG
jgi:hypothetical protein